MATLHKHFFPNNESFAYEALRAASYTHCGGAELAEVISVCSRIPPGDEEIWLREWQSAEDRAVQAAKASLTKNNRRDDLSKKLIGLSTETFYSAADLMPYKTKRIQILFEGTTLPGTMMQPVKSDKSRLTIICDGGFDSTREEIFYMNGQAALEEGFNIILFDGPGQGEALREQRLFFRNDWETVFTAVVDYALGQPTVIANKVFLMGISMGGYLVGRALCFEHRCAAAIVNDGVYDFGAAFHSQNPGLGRFLLRNGWDATMIALMFQMMRWDTGSKWAILNGMWAFGAKCSVEVLRCVILDAIEDRFLKGQPKDLFGKLRGEKEFEQFTAEEGATSHCYMGSLTRLNQAVFDYLLPRVQ
ncbi:dipeptidyl aminopeptidase acylaminoacyl-peptidase related protein [Colletotrichum acutatum]